ncbi:hypothetical protein [Streptomyces mirabilis]
MKEAADPGAAFAEVCAIIERVTGQSPGTIPLYAVDDRGLVVIGAMPEFEVHGNGRREGPIRCAA